MTMFNKVSKSFRFGNHDVTLTTGEIARQATGACICQMDDTVVLATVVAKKETKPGQDFFPLTVDYIEKTYAAGKIPGGFFKREGRPSEKETLTSRLIDRPIRPLFPDGFFNEVQVIIHVLSADPAVDPDIPAMIGASAALAISGIPFRGPIGACRVGYINDEIVINPTTEELKTSRLDLVVAGTERAVLMVESEADILPEKTMLEAVMAGHKAMQVCIQAINELVAEAGKPAWDWQPAPKNEALVARIVELCDAGLKEAYGIRSKQARTEKLREVYAACEAQLVADAEAAGTEAPDMNEVHGILFELEAKLVRSNILNGEPRIDGRDTRTVRPIEIRQSVLPRTHGSALFTRGETQVLSIATLAPVSEAQVIEGLGTETSERYMHNYNMPPYSTGDARAARSTNRREYGHGALVEKALQCVIPPVEEFPYAIRVVSEVLSSNGSTSQGSICGSTLALMDAGVPIKAPVAGISCGLIQDGDDFTTFIDIQGVEDFHGEMDFKVAGTKQGITAIQMDLKNDGLKHEIVKEAFRMTREARFQILDEIMLKAIAEPRKELADSAPKMIQMKINPDKIREVIGSGGKVIQKICADTGCKIDIEDDGSIFIASEDIEACRAARKTIENIVFEPEVGELYYGKVSNIRSDFGAWVELAPGKDGLVKIKDLEFKRTEKVEDVLKIGDMTWVKVMNVDDRGRIDLSRKDAMREKGLM